jgi:hypothetical protein
VAVPAFDTRYDETDVQVIGGASHRVEKSLFREIGLERAILNAVFLGQLAPEVLE